MIEVSHLTKEFTTAETVVALKDICLQINDGDIFGIMGMSGAGKSTLLRCIALLEQPTSGSIRMDDTDLSQMKGRELIEHRKKIGVIFQGYNLLMQRTVEDNIAFPLELDKKSKKTINDRVAELTELVGLKEKQKAYPSQLSGGQKQRVAIARALANNPEVLLCDEPTSALDALTTKSILDLLQSINRKLGVTIVIITHEIGVVRSICNRVAVINDGEIAEQGNTADVLKNPQSGITKTLLSMTGGDVK